jgi:hypothetical protein
MKFVLRCGGIVLAVGFQSVNAQEPRDYYLYQRAALPASMHLDFETATGTRDAGAFGRHGVEGLVRGGYTMAEHWTIETSLGVAQNNDSDERGLGWSAEARYGFSAEDSGWGLGFGGGYRRDYEGVSIPYLRVIGERALKRWNFAMNAVAEFPRSTATQERDAADMLFSVGTSYAMSPAIRLGLEVAGEDLEGFFDEAEAEGGAKFILGPTLNWRMGEGRLVRAHVGWLYAATANAPSNPDSTDYRGHRNGVLARVSLGFGS